MFETVVPSLIILQRRGPRKAAVKGAVAHGVLFAALSFKSRSLPVSKQLAMLKQLLGTYRKHFYCTTQNRAAALEGCRGSATLPLQKSSAGEMFLLPCA